MKALQIDRDEQEQGTKRGDSTDTQYNTRRRSGGEEIAGCYRTLDLCPRGSQNSNGTKNSAQSEALRRARQEPKLG
jgi:hypothetical protein